MTTDRGASRGSGHGDVPHILVIEDDADLQETLASALEPHGYVLRAAANGVEGLALLRAGGDHLRLVLLDLGLDGMTGLQMLVEQAADPAIAQVPVIVMSGSDDMMRSPRTKAWVHTLHKPMHLDDLVAAVARYAR